MKYVTTIKKSYSNSFKTTYIAYSINNRIIGGDCFKTTSEDIILLKRELLDTTSIEERLSTAEEIEKFLEIEMEKSRELQEDEARKKVAEDNWKSYLDLEFEKTFYGKMYKVKKDDIMSDLKKIVESAMLYTYDECKVEDLVQILNKHLFNLPFYKMVVDTRGTLVTTSLFNNEIPKTEFIYSYEKYYDVSEKYIFGSIYEEDPKTLNEHLKLAEYWLHCILLQGELKNE